MKRLKILRIAFRCLLIVLCLSISGCADDNGQIRNVIEKYYRKGAACRCVERWNSNFVTKGYDCNLSPYGKLVHCIAVDEKKVKILFSEINVQEDFATAKYSLYVINADAEDRSWTYITKLVKDDGKWKMSYTTDDVREATEPDWLIPVTGLFQE